MQDCESILSSGAFSSLLSTCPWRVKTTKRKRISANMYIWGQNASDCVNIRLVDGGRSKNVRVCSTNSKPDFVYNTTGNELEVNLLQSSTGLFLNYTTIGCLEYKAGEFVDIISESHTEVILRCKNKQSSWKALCIGEDWVENDEKQSCVANASKSSFWYQVKWGVIKMPYGE